MPSGIKIKEIAVGTGAEAQRGKIVVAHIKGYLPHGEECHNTYAQGGPARIDLKKREAIAGLRQGIEGMRVGGRRQLIVSPHLAYGKEGVPGVIPPNGRIRFEVELLEVRSAGVACPDDYLPGKHLMVFRPGEAARNLPRWQFGAHEGESAGATITLPVPGVTWRNARVSRVDCHLSPQEIGELIESSQSTSADHPEDCLREGLWADSSEKANSITRDSKTNTLCITIVLWERGAVLFNYSLPETSPVLANARFYQIITKALAPSLQEPKQ